MGDAALEGLADGRLKLGGAVLVELAQKGGDDGAEIVAAHGGLGEQTLAVGRGPEQPVLAAKAAGLTLVPGELGDVLGDLDAGVLVEAARMAGDGRHGVISPDQARRKAAQMIARIKAGEDPNPEAAKKPSGPTVAELAERYLTEHVEVRCKPRTVEACRWLVKKFVLPDLGGMAIAEVDRENITDLHHKHRNTPYQANRILEVVRKMFNLAEAWGLRDDGSNPCRHVQKYKEKKRERFLTEEEFHRLGRVLNEIEAEGPEHRSSVTAIRLLMLTGSRLNEIQTLRWEDVDLEAAELRLPDTKTGARMVPLSRAAVGVLAALPRQTGNPPGSSSARTPARISPISRSPGGEFAPAPNSTTYEFMTCDTALRPGPWHSARAFR